MSPEDIAHAITEHTQGVPHVQAMADICGGLRYPIALEFAKHLPASETAHLRECWDTDGPQRVAFLFGVWCAHQLSTNALPEGINEPSERDGYGE